MKTVLVIDDNFAIRENTAELLETSGYRVITAADGRQGFEMARSFLPGLIICDIMMPDTDGPAFFELIKSETNTAAIPVIFFSAGSMPFPLRSSEFLNKPFTDHELLQAVGRHLGPDQLRD